MRPILRPDRIILHTPRAILPHTAQATESAIPFAMRQSTTDLDLAQLTRGLWVARLYYFFFYAALGTISPFLNIYLVENGLTGLQVGILASIPPLVALVAGPFWSAIADRWQAQRGVLALLAFVAGMASLLLIWIHAFWGVLLVLVVLNFFRSPIAAIVDGTLMGIVTRYGVPYGKQRVFGSFGWIVASFSVGWIAGMWGLQVIFWIHAICLGLLCALLGLRMPVERSGEPERIHYAAGVRQLIRLSGYRGILAFMAAFGAGMAANAGFLGLYMVSMGASTQLVGITNAVNTIPEIPMMFMGDRWLQRFGSRALILLGGVGFAFTWLLFGVATQPWMFPLFTPIIGLSYGLSWIAIVTFANSSAPAGMRASAQGIANAAMSGIGVAGGAFISGILWDRSGGQAVFLVAGAIMVLGTLYFAFATRRSISAPQSEHAA